MTPVQNASRIFLWSLLGVVCFSILLIYSWSSILKKQYPKIEIYEQLPNFSFIECNGLKRGLADLKGKIWVADFIFTRCSGVCPMMSRKMSALQKEFEQKGIMRWVSFSVDPDWDTPDRLKSYAEKYDAPKDAWWFLTGKRSEIHQLVKEGFKLGVVEGKNLEEPIIHSNRFVLVDAIGRVRGFYKASEQDEMDHLKRDINQLINRVNV